MKTYRMIRDRHGRCQAYVDARVLPPQSTLRDHSPDGFNWGYTGSGPAQLALAILVDALGSPQLAEALYQHFKSAVVATADFDEWSVTDEWVMGWCSCRLDWVRAERGRSADK